MTEYSNEALVELIRNAKKTDERMRYLSDLYQQNYLYILKICKKYSGHEDVDDLMQESFFGLRLAVDRYDQEQGIPFMNYAGICIDGIIRRYIGNCGSVVRLPINLRENIIKYIKAEKTFLQDHGREPSDQEIAEKLSLTIAQLKRLKERRIYLKAASLDIPISEGEDDFTYKDAIQDQVDRYEQLTDALDENQKRNDIRYEVEHLKENESQIIKEYYFNDKSLDVIGKERGCSSENVRQIRNRALRNLKRAKRIRQYENDYLSAKAYSGTSYAAYKKTGTSATERTAIEHYEQGIQSRIAEAERDIKRNKKKGIITLDDGYLQIRIEQYKKHHPVSV